MTTEIRANTLLPARREAITLDTCDGLSLIGELALPAENPPRATLICLHPLPTHGGMMDSHLFRKAAFRLPALADYAVLRFNTRGTISEAGRSDGQFSKGVEERFDVAAALEFAEFRDLPNVWVVGWSFGTDLTLAHAADPIVQGAVLISPPRRWSTDEQLKVWADTGKPVYAFIPEFDDYLRPEDAPERFAALPQLQIVPFAGAKHLFVGYAEQVLDTLVATITPEVPTPLPSTWDGHCENRTPVIVND
ncbi:alpha/beta hydrolase [Pseudonocardiaceae bacterium YIM PH 21723]|nr:alpha/beta hydrolase [Pseudonocardiaceae bacterium YIM PH 21723]